MGYWDGNEKHKNTDDFYLRVVKTIFYERAHIFKPPCNVLFII